MMHRANARVACSSRPSNPRAAHLLWQIRLVLAVSLLILAGAACSEKSTPQNTFEWKEEILLHDGRKIIAERVDVMGGWAEPGQSGAPQERRITFPDPDNPAKKYTHRITGSSNYLLLDFDKGTPWLIVIVGPFSTDTDCPIGSYETFTWSDEAWRSVVYSSLPPKVRKPNMTVSYVLDSNREGEPFGEMRKPGRLLSATHIAMALSAAQRHHETEATWRLVQTNHHGRPIDCQAYPKSLNKTLSQ